VLIVKNQTFNMVLRKNNNRPKCWREPALRGSSGDRHPQPAQQTPHAALKPTTSPPIAQTLCPNPARKKTAHMPSASSPQRSCHKMKPQPLPLPRLAPSAARVGHACLGCKEQLSTRRSPASQRTPGAGPANTLPRIPATAPSAPFRLPSSNVAFSNYTSPRAIDQQTWPRPPSCAEFHKVVLAPYNTRGIPLEETSTLVAMRRGGKSSHPGPGVLYRGGGLEILTSGPLGPLWRRGREIHVSRPRVLYTPSRGGGGNPYNTSVPRSPL